MSVDRLREKLSMAGLGLGSEDRRAYVARVNLTVADCDELSALLAEVRELREALEPFARHVDPVTGLPDTALRYVRARAALSPATPEAK